MEAETMTMDIFASAVKECLSVYLTDCILENKEMMKNNGSVMHGVVIHEKGSNLAPVIYLEGFFERYEDGRDFDDIVKEIAQVYEANKMSGYAAFDTAMILDYETARGNICLKVVNTEHNEKLLSDVPNLPFLDLSVVFYVKLPDIGGGGASVAVTNSIIDAWGIDVETLYGLAKKNNERLLPSIVLPMWRVLSEELGGISDSNFDDDIVGFEADMPELFVVTNKEKFNGASAILDDGLLLHFAKRIGRGYYILPSSIHELLLLPDGEGVDSDVIRTMVKEVNESEVRPEERLSDNVYRFNYESGLVEIA